MTKFKKLKEKQQVLMACYQNGTNGHSPRSGIKSESSFLITCYIITVLNFFLEPFVQYLTKSKNGFPIVFSNLARKGSGVFFSS